MWMWESQALSGTANSAGAVPALCGAWIDLPICSLPAAAIAACQDPRRPARAAAPPHCKVRLRVTAADEDSMLLIAAPDLSGFRPIGAHVAELAHPGGGEFAAVAGLLGAAEGHTRIGG